MYTEDRGFLFQLYCLCCLGRKIRT